MLSLTNIEIVQVNPENGQAKKTQARLESFKRDSLDELDLYSQQSNQLKR
jgi:hypothetical protein